MLGRAAGRARRAARAASARSGSSRNISRPNAGQPIADRGRREPADAAGRDQDARRRRARNANSAAQASVSSVIARRTGGSFAQPGLGAVERGDDEAGERAADHHRAREDDRVAELDQHARDEVASRPCRCGTAMNAADHGPEQAAERVDHRLARGPGARWPSRTPSADRDDRGGVQAPDRVDDDERDRPGARVDDRALVAQHVDRAGRVLGGGWVTRACAPRASGCRRSAAAGAAPAACGPRAGAGCSRGRRT